MKLRSKKYRVSLSADSREKLNYILTNADDKTIEHLLSQLIKNDVECVYERIGGRENVKGQMLLFDPLKIEDILKIVEHKTEGEKLVNNRPD